MFLLRSFQWRRETVFVIFGGYTDNVLPDVKLKEKTITLLEIGSPCSKLRLHSCL
jgi:hypothetical protein